MNRTKLYRTRRVLPALALLGLALLAPSALLAQAPRVPIFPTLAANPDLVLCGPYDTIVAGTANWGTEVSGAAHSREFLTLGQQYRIRQDGTVSRIRLNLQDAAGLTGFYFRVWRKIDQTYDLVGSSENLAPAMIAGPNTLDLTRPIAVLEGDYYGYRAESTTAANFFARTRANVSSYFVPDASAGSTDFAWEAQAKVKGRVLPIEIYMQAPILVGIGDSLMSGFPAHHTFLEVVPTGRIGADIVSYLGERWRVTRQNMGIPAQSVSRVVARFTSDVVNLKPRLALLEGGGAADIGSSDGLGRTLETYLATFGKLLDACQANSIKPVVLLILPGGPGTPATQSRQRDSWNAALRDLAKGYAGAVVVDASPYVGVYRPDGAPNNLDSIDTPYSAGDIGHFTPAGYQRIAQAIVDQYTEP
jgi:lysophospholipase L1-like esterase